MNRTAALLALMPLLALCIFVFRLMRADKGALTIAFDWRLGRKREKVGVVLAVIGLLALVVAGVMAYLYPMADAMARAEFDTVNLERLAVAAMTPALLLSIFVAKCVGNAAEWYHDWQHSRIEARELRLLLRARDGEEELARLRARYWSAIDELRQAYDGNEAARKLMIDRQEPVGRLIELYGDLLTMTEGEPGRDASTRERLRAAGSTRPRGSSLR